MDDRDGKKEYMCVSYREWRGAVSEAREEDKKMHLRKKVKKRQKWRMKADVDHAFGVPRAYTIENAKRAEYVPLCKRRVKTLRGPTTMVTLLLAFSLCDDSSSSPIASTIFNVIFQ